MTEELGDSSECEIVRVNHNEEIEQDMIRKQSPILLIGDQISMESKKSKMSNTS